MVSAPSSNQWGVPTAPKRALLIHGVTLAGSTWVGTAQSLVDAGYFVVAPNLIGHGYREANDMRVQALAEDLQPYFKDGGYDCIVGHSLGALVSLALLPSLPPSKPTSVILIDPPLELTQELIEKYRHLFVQAVQNARDVEAIAAANPSWSRQDVVARSIGLQTCTTDTVERMFAQNKPWSFSSHFLPVPRHVFLTVLVSDPALSDLCPLDRVPAHPQIQAVLLEGIDHWTQFVKPELVPSHIFSSVAKVEKGL